MKPLFVGIARMFAVPMIVASMLGSAFGSSTAYADMGDVERLRLRAATGSTSDVGLLILLGLGAISEVSSRGGNRRPQATRQSENDRSPLPDGGYSAEGEGYCGSDSHGSPVYYGELAR